MDASHITPELKIATHYDGISRLSAYRRLGGSEKEEAMCSEGLKFGERMCSGRI